MLCKCLQVSNSTIPSIFVYLCIQIYRKRCINYSLCRIDFESMIFFLSQYDVNEIWKVWYYNVWYKICASMRILHLKLPHLFVCSMCQCICKLRHLAKIWFHFCINKLFQPDWYNVIFYVFSFELNCIIMKRRSSVVT